MPPVEQEYVVGPDVFEIEDPTVEEEAALKAAQLEAEERAEEEAEAAEEGEDDDD